MQKAISELVVGVLILTIGVTLVGLAFVFLTQMNEQTTSEIGLANKQSVKKIGSCLQILSFDEAENILRVKNCGKYDIDNVTVFIDNSPAFSMPIDAKPNQAKSIQVSAGEGVHEIKLVSDYVTAAVSITIKGLFITFEVKNDAGAPVAKFGDSGNITLKGTCSASANCIAPADAPFVVQNPLSETASYIDNSGNLCIEDANCNDNDANCDSPGDNSFIIQDSNGANVAYINSAGNLCLKGSLVQNGLP